MNLSNTKILIQFGVYFPKSILVIPLRQEFGHSTKKFLLLGRNIKWLKLPFYMNTEY